MAGQGNAFRVSIPNRKIITPHDPRISKVIPHTEAITHNGKQFMLVPHGETESKLLRNFGYGVPSPILVHYNWAKSTPFESQRITAKVLCENHRAYVLSELGTGKTRAALFACDHLMNEKRIERVLIAAPLSTLTPVWELEIFQHFPHRTAVVLHGTRQQRLKRLSEDFDFYIINHDGVNTILSELMARTDIQAVLIDELALLRNYRTRRWKAFKALVHPRRFVWGMTGSPTPKEPLDAYGQAKLLTPETVPKYFTAFRSMTMYQVTQFKWLPLQKANEVVHKALQPSVRFTREECIDLPPTTYSMREVLLTSEQKAAYKEMLNTFQVQVAHSLMRGTPITAANAGVQVFKLIQISSGFVYGDNQAGGTYSAALDASPRESALKEIIDQTERKLIVFAPYIFLVGHLEQLLKAEYGDDAVNCIHGQVTTAKRNQIFAAFQGSRNPRVLVAHPATMSHGLTLTAANTIIWYAPVPSLETYEQANGRITRPSQTSHTHIIHIQSTSVERRIYNTLQKRGDIQAELLRMFTGE